MRPRFHPHIKVNETEPVLGEAVAEPGAVETGPTPLVPVIEPIRDPSPGKYEEETVTQEPIVASENSVAIPPETDEPEAPIEVPVDEKAVAAEAGEVEDAELLTTWESVVLSGSIPRPEVVLSTSEPAAAPPAPESLPKDED